MWRREKGSIEQQRLLAPLPITLPENYLESVNEILHEETLRVLRGSVNKGKPYGKDAWVETMVEKFDLTHTMRGAGRPRQH